ncbi:MAG: AraC family ligand binding domain-containing protein [Gemmatimonadota bacterium]|nr:AraC family ligand binding domain-containing protein [Gemmatimonadota bacterium]
MKADWIVTAAVFALSTTASTKHETTAQPAVTPATFVNSAEIKAAIDKHNTGAFSDSPLRVVPIESKYNVGIAVVRRSKVNGRMLPDALIHDDVTEVYQIVEGEAVMVTGGALQSAKPLTAVPVVNEIGPSSAGQSIVGGTSHRVAPGDMIIIPPHTPHGFVDIATPRIVYTIIRIDPQKVLELRSRPQ